MRRRLQKAVDHWLRLERAGAGDPERALRRVFRALPPPPLPAGLVDRVMLGAGLAPPSTAPLGLAWRLSLVGALALAAAATATAPRLLGGLFQAIGPGDLLRFAANALIATCQRLAEGLAVWQSVSSIGSTLADALSAPPVLAALVAATLVSAGGLRMLHGLLAVERRGDDARA